MRKYRDVSNLGEICACGHVLRAHYKMRWGRVCYECEPDAIGRELEGDGFNDEFHLPADRKADAESYNHMCRHFRIQPEHSYWGVTHTGTPMVIGLDS